MAKILMQWANEMHARGEGSDPQETAEAAFRTISDAADELDLPQHVLRFWETRFNHIRPLKRGGGRRYYRVEDVDLLRGIKHLLYGEGYTIRGVQRILKSHGVKFVQRVWSNPGSLRGAGIGAPLDENGERPIPVAPLLLNPRVVPTEEAHTQVEPLPVVPVSVPPIASMTPMRSAAPIAEHNRQRLNGALNELLEARRILIQASTGPLFSLAEDLDVE